VADGPRALAVLDAVLVFHPTHPVREQIQLSRRRSSAAIGVASRTRFS
jgi:hypothetical protein